MGKKRIKIYFIIAIFYFLNCASYGKECNRHEDCADGELCAEIIGDWFGPPTECMTFPNRTCKFDEECNNCYDDKKESFICHENQCFSKGDVGENTIRSAYWPCK